MAGIEIVHAADCDEWESHPIADHAFVSAHSGTPAGTARLVSPPGYSLWLVVARLAAGTEVMLPEDHGEEAVYVSAGALAVDGKSCPPEGAVIIEKGASPTLRAAGPTSIIQMGPYDRSMPTGGLLGSPGPGREVHVVGPGGTYAAVEPGRDTHYFADSTCPTCRLTLLYTSRTTPYVSATHSHSVDELIHVLWGELRLGNQVARPGDTLAVDADRRYGFRSGDEGFGFLNYRRDASQQTIERGTEPRMEGGLVNGLQPVMDLV